MVTKLCQKAASEGQDSVSSPVLVRSTLAVTCLYLPEISENSLLKRYGKIPKSSENSGTLKNLKVNAEFANIKGSALAAGQEPMQLLAIILKKSLTASIDLEKMKSDLDD